VWNQFLSFIECILPEILAFFERFFIVFFRFLLENNRKITFQADYLLENRWDIAQTFFSSNKKLRTS